MGVKGTYFISVYNNIWRIYLYTTNTSWTPFWNQFQTAYFLNNKNKLFCNNDLKKVFHIYNYFSSLSNVDTFLVSMHTILQRSFIPHSNMIMALMQSAIWSDNLFSCSYNLYSYHLQLHNLFLLMYRITCNHNNIGTITYPEKWKCMDNFMLIVYLKLLWYDYRYRYIYLALKIL